jgi:hypothetical protein
MDQSRNKTRLLGRNWQMLTICITLRAQSAVVLDKAGGYVVVLALRCGQHIKLQSTSSGDDGTSTGQFWVSGQNNVNKLGWTLSGLQHYFGKTTMNEDIAVKQVKIIGLNRLRRGAMRLFCPAKAPPHRQPIESRRSDSERLHGS